MYFYLSTCLYLHLRICICLRSFCFSGERWLTHTMREDNLGRGNSVCKTRDAWRYMATWETTSSSATLFKPALDSSLAWSLCFGPINQIPGICSFWSVWPPQCFWKCIHCLHFPKIRSLKDQLKDLSVGTMEVLSATSTEAWTTYDCQETKCVRDILSVTISTSVSFGKIHVSEDFPENKTNRMCAV